MRLAFFFLIIALPYTVSISCFAQSEKRDFKRAENLFYGENFKEALTLYTEILQNDPLNSQAKYKAELCTLLMKNNRDLTLERLFEFSDSEGVRDRFYNYWLGRIYLSRYRFDEAITSFEAFLTLDVYKSQEIIELTNDLISKSQWAREQYGTPQLFRVELLEGRLTNELLSYHPGQNELIIYGNAADETENLKTVKVDGNRQYESENITLRISDVNQIHLDYLNAQSLLYKNEEDELFHLNLSNGTWNLGDAYPFKFPVKNTGSTFTINVTENRMVISEKDFLGMYDLYEILKEDDKWSKPRFMEEINSPSHEKYPFFTADGSKLYFSSNHDDAIGGYDVFVSEFREDKWSSRINMGYPINTFDNEIRFIEDSEKKNGYFMSDRLESEGGFNIYYYQELTFDQIEGVVAEAGTGKRIHGLRVELRSSDFPEDNFVSFSNDIGTYNSQIISGGSITAKIYQNERLVHQESFFVPISSGTPSRKDFMVKLDESSRNLASALVTNDKADIQDTGYTPLYFIANKFRPGQKAMLNNLYFQFGSSELAEGSERTLSILMKLMNENPDLQIEIAGYTDSLGPESYNQWLSLRRAKKIEDFLIARGIQQDRLSPRGYGEDSPIASNDDEDDGRSLNRRIEIIVAE